MTKKVENFNQKIFENSETVASLQDPRKNNLVPVELDFSELERIKDIAIVEFNEVNSKLITSCLQIDQEYIHHVHNSKYLCQIYRSQEPEFEGSILPNSSYFKLLLARATAILKNKDADNLVAFSIFEEISGELSSLNKLILLNKKDPNLARILDKQDPNQTLFEFSQFYYIIPYLVNFSYLLCQMNYKARAFILLDKASQIIDQSLKTLPAYKYNRMIICAMYVWKNIEIILDNFGVVENRNSFIENWDEKLVLMKKHEKLFI